jgi:hypothetical protein
MGDVSYRDLHCMDFLYAYNPLTNSLNFKRDPSLPAPRKHVVIKPKISESNDIFWNIELCGHNILRKRCGVCLNGGRLCEHQYLYAGCKWCSPDNFCLHQNFLWTCRDCAKSITPITPGRKIKCAHKAHSDNCVVCSPHLYCGHSVKHKSKPFALTCPRGTDCVTKRVKCKKCIERGMLSIYSRVIS